MILQCMEYIYDFSKHYKVRLLCCATAKFDKVLSRLLAHVYMQNQCIPIYFSAYVRYAQDFAKALPHTQVDGD